MLGELRLDLEVVPEVLDVLPGEGPELLGIAGVGGDRHQELIEVAVLLRYPVVEAAPKAVSHVGGGGGSGLRLH